jgi:biopolymer transport protein TolR
MGFNLQQPTRKRRQGQQIMSDINVTPFVDVMLVLLIVFMISAPLLTVGVDVNLPKTEAKNLSDDQKPLVISINHHSKIFIQESPVDLNKLVPRLQAITKNNLEAKIYIRGDEKLSYGQIMMIMGRINAAGFSKVALLADLPDASSRSSRR